MQRQLFTIGEMRQRQTANHNLSMEWFLQGNAESRDTAQYLVTAGAPLGLILSSVEVGKAYHALAAALESQSKEWGLWADQLTRAELGQKYGGTNA